MKITHGKSIEEYRFEINFAPTTTLVVLIFWASWYHETEILADWLEQNFQASKNVKIVPINFDTNLPFSISMRVKKIPTIIFFKKGQEIERIIEKKEASKIMETINRLLE